MLIENGASLEMINVEGKTPVDVADPKVVQYLKLKEMIS